MYTLWQSGKLLGRFAERQSVMHHGQRVGAFGILEPTEAFVGMSSMMQTRARIFPGQPVFQHPLEAVWFGTEQPRRRSMKGPVALKPLSDEEARGIPPERVLEIRTEDGVAIDADMVVLQLYAIPDGIDPSTLQRENELVGTSRETWTVHYAAASRSPNEEL